MPIDHARIKEVLRTNPLIDRCAAYYRQLDAQQQRIGPLVPEFKDVLRKALKPCMCVLDIGCGRGDTLLDMADFFRHGTGVDESQDVMLAMAERARQDRRITNADFRWAEARHLPFEDTCMDLVFSERGPMGHQDVTLIEALRVLRAGGLILVETIGELNSWQTAAAFTEGGSKPATALKVLETERERFERLGVSIQVLASRIETIQFPDIYEWLTSQCYTWNEPRREKLDALTPAYFERFAEMAGDAQGRINVTRHTVWIGGAKQ